MNVLNDAVRRLLSSRVAGEIRRELLPEEERIRVRLDEVCRNCPVQGAQGLSRGERRQAIDQCRRSYFAVLLESFVGRPGEGEIDRLYAQLRQCERCFESSKSDTGPLPAKKEKRQEHR